MAGYLRCWSSFQSLGLTVLELLWTSKSHKISLKFCRCGLFCSALIIPLLGFWAKAASIWTCVLASFLWLSSKLSCHLLTSPCGGTRCRITPRFGILRIPTCCQLPLDLLVSLALDQRVPVYLLSSTALFWTSYTFQAEHGLSALKACSHAISVLSLCCASATARSSCVPLISE